MEESVKSVAEDIVEVFSAIFPEDEEAADAGFAEYLGYYNVSKNNNLKETSAYTVLDN